MIFCFYFYLETNLPVIKEQFEKDGKKDNKKKLIIF